MFSRKAKQKVGDGSKEKSSKSNRDVDSPPTALANGGLPPLPEPVPPGRAVDAVASPIKVDEASLEAAKPWNRGYEGQRGSTYSGPEPHYPSGPFSSYGDSPYGYGNYLGNGGPPPSLGPAGPYGRQSYYGYPPGPRDSSYYGHPDMPYSAADSMMSGAPWDGRSQFSMGPGNFSARRSVMAVDSPPMSPSGPLPTPIPATPKRSSLSGLPPLPGLGPSTTKSSSSSIASTARQNSKPSPLLKSIIKKNGDNSLRSSPAASPRVSFVPSGNSSGRGGSEQDSKKSNESSGIALKNDSATTSAFGPAANTTKPSPSVEPAPMLELPSQDGAPGMHSESRGLAIIAPPAASPAGLAAKRVSQSAERSSPSVELSPTVSPAAVAIIAQVEAQLTPRRPSPTSGASPAPSSKVLMKPSAVAAPRAASPMAEPIKGPPLLSMGSSGSMPLKVSTNLGKETESNASSSAHSNVRPWNRIESPIPSPSLRWSRDIQTLAAASSSEPISPAEMRLPEATALDDDLNSYPTLESVQATLTSGQSSKSRRSSVGTDPLPTRELGLSSPFESRVLLNDGKGGLNLSGEYRSLAPERAALLNGSQNNRSQAQTTKSLPQISRKKAESGFELASLIRGGVHDPRLPPALVLLFCTMVAVVCFMKASSDFADPQLIAAVRTFDLNRISTGTAYTVAKIFGWLLTIVAVGVAVGAWKAGRVPMTAKGRRATGRSGSTSADKEVVALRSPGWLFAQIVVSTSIALGLGAAAISVLGWEVSTAPVNDLYSVACLPGQLSATAAARDTLTSICITARVGLAFSLLSVAGTVGLHVATVFLLRSVREKLARDPGHRQV